MGLLMMLGAGTLAAAYGKTPGVSGEVPGTPGPSGVLVVTMAGLTWEDVAAGRTPGLQGLADHGSMAALSIRTVDNPADNASAYASIGAGDRARGGGSPAHPLSPVATPGADGGWQAAQWGQLTADNKGLHFGAVPGSLGQAVHDHGGRTAVEPVPGRASFAPLALADRSGRVDPLDPASPAAVVLLELTGTPQDEDAALMARLTGRLWRDLLILGVPAPGSAGPDRLMVAVGAGADLPGATMLTSATTHRAGLITLPDIAPGILTLLGIRTPSSMTGQPFHATAAVPGNRLAALVHYERSALAYRTRQGPFLVIFGLFGFAVFLAAWLCLRRQRPRGAAFVGVAGLAVAALPLASLVPAISGAESWRAAPFAVLIAAADLVLVAVAVAGPWRRHLLGPPVFLATLSVGAITADLLTGGAAQLDSLIGYSPIVAGRFYGMSAPTFAVFASFVLLLTGLAAGRAGKHRSLVAAGIGLATLVLAGAPMFGAKFGAILTLVPAFGVLCHLLARRRLSGGRIALLGAATVAAGLVIGGLDALRPAASRTHIGRFVASLVGGGTGTVSDVLLRKADVNLGIFLRSPVAYTAPLAVVAMAIVLLRPPPWLASPPARIPGLRAGLLAALTANAVAMFVNDSGVAIPAMGLGVGVPLVLVILLRAQATAGLPEAPDPPG